MPDHRSDNPAGARTVDARVWAALIVVYLVWGSTYFGIRLVIDSVPPLLSGGARFLLAGTIMAVAVAVRGGPRALAVPRRQLVGPAIVGVLLLAGGNGLVTVGELYIPTGISALLVASVPLWLVVFRTANRDVPPPMTLAGVLTGFAGLALLSLAGGDTAGARPVGIVITILAALSWATGSFVASRLPMPRDTFAATTYQMYAGGIGLVGAGLIGGEGGRLDLAAITWQSWLAFGYLVTFGSLLAFTAYAWLLHTAPLSLVATYAYVNPVVAVALGAMFLDERITWVTAAAGAITVLGVGLVVSTERRPRPRREPAKARPAENPGPA